MSNNDTKFIDQSDILLDRKDELVGIRSKDTGMEFLKVPSNLSDDQIFELVGSFNSVFSAGFKMGVELTISDAIAQQEK